MSSRDWTSSTPPKHSSHSSPFCTSASWVRKFLTVKMRQATRRIAEVSEAALLEPLGFSSTSNFFFFFFPTRMAPNMFIKFDLLCVETLKSSICGRTSRLNKRCHSLKATIEGD